MQTLTYRAIDLGCTKYTCPASASIYGYAPNLIANILFATFFSLSCLIFTIQFAVCHRRWFWFTLVFIIGTALEAVGYGGRVILSQDPFSSTGFAIQIILLTFAPAFMTAGVYVLLKHIVLVLGPRYSILKPAQYTYIFVAADVVAIVLQGVGGVISGTGLDPSNFQIGLSIMIAGLASQVVSLSIFLLLAAFFFVRIWLHRDELRIETQALRSNPTFKAYLAAWTLGFCFIFIRCSFRIAELKNGLGSSILRNENEFIGFESVMVTLACFLYNAFHPAFDALVDAKAASGTKVTALHDAALPETITV